MISELSLCEGNAQRGNSGLFLWITTLIAIARDDDSYVLIPTPLRSSTSAQVNSKIKNMLTKLKP